MKVPSSSRALSRLTVVALLSIVLQVSIGAPIPAATGQLIRGTPIDSPPATNALAARVDPPAKPVSANPSPTNSLPHPDTATTQTNQGYLEIGFDKLSGFPARFACDFGGSNDVMVAHATRITYKIPEAIQTLDNRKVAVKGFMLPLQQESGLATEFILLRSRMMCCYGMMPKINEWIHVRMGGKGARCIMDTPLTIYGTLHVEEYRENRTMLGIYRLDGEKMEVPAGL